MKLPQANPLMFTAGLLNKQSANIVFHLVIVVLINVLIAVSIKIHIF